MRAFLFFAFCLFNFISFAQTPTKFDPQDLPTRYRIDSATEVTTTLATLKKNKERNISDRDKVHREFADLILQLKREYFSGQIYFDKPEMEEYVNDIFRKIAPDSIKDDTSYHVYLVKDPRVNAFAMYDNKFYVNIGLVAEAGDEGEIAGTLAHELGHYLHYDMYTNYVKDRRAQKAGNSLYNVYGIAGLITGIDATTSRINNEAIADSFSLKLLPPAGYSLQSLANSFVHYMKLDKQYEMYYDRFSIFSYAPTHPETQSRYVVVKEYMKAHPSKGSGYLVSKEKFERFKKEAESESLSLLLQTGMYHNCILKAFEDYLLDIDNSEYVYYMLEAMRRWELRYPKMANMKFITETKYSDGGEKALLSNLMKGYLTLSPKRIAKTKATDLLDSSVIEFVTYKEAFLYFRKKAEALACKECWMTAALYDYGHKEEYTSEVQKYVQQDSTRYPRIADFLLAGGKKEEEQKIAVLTHFSLETPHPPWNEATEKRVGYSSAFLQQFNHFADTCFTTRKEVRLLLKQEQLNDTLREYAHLLDIPSSGIPLGHLEDIDFKLLFPDLFELCLQLQVNEIQFHNYRFISLLNRPSNLRTGETVTLRTTVKRYVLNSNRDRFSESESKGSVFLNKGFARKKILSGLYGEK